jgi:two-component system, NarL family, response regulator DegU
MKSAVAQPGLSFRFRAHAGREGSAKKVVPKSGPAKVGMRCGIHHQQGVTGPTSGPCAFGHDGGVKTMRSAKQSTGTGPAETEMVQVLVADSGPIQSQLLTRALKSRREFQVSAVALETAVIHNFMQSNHADVVLIAGNHLPDLSLLRWLRVSYPKIAPVLLAESDDRELVVNAFRAGAKGIFLFTHTPFPMLCKCIHRVFQGEVWLNSQQMNYVLDALSEVPTLRVVNSNGRFLLTPREEQVVALVADGLTNRGVAVELGLSEHTIKKYLLRIFDKVGISSRVELVLYAMAHGEHRPAEWMPSNTA